MQCSWKRKQTTSWVLCQSMQPIIHWVKIRRTFSEFRTKKDRGSKVAFIFATVPAQFVLGHVLFFLAVLILTVCWDYLFEKVKNDAWNISLVSSCKKEIFFHHRINWDFSFNIDLWMVFLSSIKESSMIIYYARCALSFIYNV